MWSFISDAASSLLVICCHQSDSHLYVLKVVNIKKNIYREMTWPWCRILIVTAVAITDVGVYIYDHYSGSNNDQLPISYPAHISGAIAGLLIGITCLKNLHWEKHEKYIWAISVCIFVLLIGSAMIFSIANPSHFTSSVRQTYQAMSNVNCSSGPIIL